MSINNSGDFVAIIETATNKQVFLGNLLGQNNKVIIAVVPTHLADPTAHLASNHDDIKNLSHSLYADLLEVCDYLSFSRSLFSLSLSLSLCLSHAFFSSKPRVSYFLSPILVSDLKPRRKQQNVIK